MKVNVRPTDQTNNPNTFLGSATLPFTLVTAGPATGVTLDASPTVPPVAGTPVLFTALGSGGSGSYEYQFWRLIGSVWTEVRPYSTTPTWTWDTTGAASGTHYVTVYVRNAGSTAVVEAYQQVSYVIASSGATGVTLDASPTVPPVAGTPVLFTALGSGGSGSYEYQFWRLIGSVWTEVRPYSTTPTWTWDTTGAASGTHYVTVYVRNAGSTADVEAYQQVSYVIASSGATGVTLDASPTVPPVAGTPVLFTALGSGGSGSYEYQFWRLIGSVWTEVRPYSTTPTWTWDTTGAASGTHYVTVYVRNAGSTADVEAYQTGTLRDRADSLPA